MPATAPAADPAPAADAASDLRPVVAALANKTAREEFARIVLGGEVGATAPRRRAVAHLQKAGLIRPDNESPSGFIVDDVSLRAMLQQGTTPRPHGPARFLTGVGRIDRYPANAEERHELLMFVLPRIVTQGETLSEAAVNERLNSLTDDTARLRRMLVDHGLVVRAASGTDYRLVEN